MKQSQVINVSIKYKSDEVAKQHLVNYLVDLLLEDEFDYLGGEDFIPYETQI